MSESDAGNAASAETELTIVIASASTEEHSSRCLQALAPQAAGGNIQIVLVGEARTRVEASSMRLEMIEKTGLVPQLWAEGVNRARGKVVGLLTTSVVPDADWVDLTIAAHADGTHAVGGPIEPARRLRTIDWAVYLCRYSSQMLPFDAGGSDIAGDNASYLVDALRAHADAYDAGFWETFVHEQLRADGCRLVRTPARVVRFTGGALFGAFARQRFEHGRVHARLRARAMSRRSVVARFLLAPLVPMLLTVRVARNAVTRRRVVSRFVVALPYILSFFSCWAAGEAVGYLRHLRHG
jgi:hypothetical protein